MDPRASLTNPSACLSICFPPLLSRSKPVCLSFIDSLIRLLCLSSVVFNFIHPSIYLSLSTWLWIHHIIFFKCLCYFYSVIYLWIYLFIYLSTHQYIRLSSIIYLSVCLRISTIHVSIYLLICLQSSVFEIICLSVYQFAYESITHKSSCILYYFNYLSTNLSI